jgi:hypothetical protein
MDKEKQNENRIEKLRHDRPLGLTLLGLPNAVNTSVSSSSHLLRSDKSSNNATFSSLDHNSGDGERVARSLLEDVKEVSIGWIQMDPLNRPQRKGCLDVAHLLCCARKADPLALSCSSSVFSSAASS